LLIALLAAGCMLVTDIVATAMVMFEAANRGWAAGALDCLGWYFSIATTAISVNALNGHSLMGKVWVLLFVGASNVFGTKLGQVTGHWLLTRKGLASDPVSRGVVRGFLGARNKGDSRK
jgi:hypothetical protein